MADWVYDISFSSSRGSPTCFVSDVGNTTPSMLRGCQGLPWILPSSNCLRKLYIHCKLRSSCSMSRRSTVCKTFPMVALDPASRIQVKFIRSRNPSPVLPCIFMLYSYSLPEHTPSTHSTSLRTVVKFSAPSDVIITTSSIRTPPTSS